LLASTNHRRVSNSVGTVAGPMKAATAILIETDTLIKTDTLIRTVTLIVIRINIPTIRTEADRKP
jgi:hypothetical protein